MAEVSFGQTFAQITAAGLTPTFELQFSQIQNTLIGRLNNEIADLNDDRVTDVKLRRLRAEGQKLIDAQPVVEQFLQETRNTLVSIEDISDDLNNLNDFLGTDDNVIETEVDAFVAQRDAIADRIENLFIFSNVDIPNFDAVKLLKDQLVDFRALTPVVGTKSVDNLAVTEGVSDITTRSFNALALVQITVEQAVDVSLNIQREFADVDVDILELETLAFADKQIQIDNLRADAANLLQIFSLAFESQALFAQNFANALRPQTPGPGSILNLFT